VREERLRWYGHVMRRDEEELVRDTEIKQSLHKKSIVESQ
jgi:hypothetical protein